MSAHARTLWSLALVTSVLAAAGPASAAPATTVTCGQVVTTDVVLDGDLACGFSIGADGITVDLAGHTVSDGIIAVGSHSHVTITGGTVVRGGVTAFQPASSPQTSALTIRNMTFRDAPFAGFSSTGLMTGAVIVDSHFIGNRVGIRGDSFSRGLSVQGSEFRDNRAAVGLTFNAGGYTFTGNTFSGNGTAVAVTEGGGNTFEGNQFTGNGCGYCGFISGANRFHGNEFRSNEVGVELLQVFSTGNVVDHNRFHDNGVGVRFGAAGQPGQFQGSVVSGNVFNHNATAGLQYFGSLPSAGAAQEVTVSGNRAIRNGTGLYVFVGPGQPAVVVRGNVANVNAGYGIEVSGATDGGGNHAANNGNPGQCLGVLC